MKLHSLEIKNFRAIKEICLDFTDYYGVPRPISLIVGPNSSGKTSILDAIHIIVKVFEKSDQLELRDGLKYSAGQLIREGVSRYEDDLTKPELREGLQFRTQQLVRGKGNRCEIGFSYSIEKYEAEAINEALLALELPQYFEFLAVQPPLIKPSKVTWKFPNIYSPFKRLYSSECIEYIPENSLRVLGARGLASTALSLDRLNPEIFDRIGGVCYLDQRRTVRLFNNITHKDNKRNNSHSDVLSWLNDYYRKDLTWNEQKYGESYWKRVKRLFNKICFPSELIGLESGPVSDTLIIKRNGMEYDLNQMSSGEHQVLRILVGLAADTAKNSIVLIDEVELHLHPTWQKKLIQVLREDESNNQYIFTTHSPTVLEMFYDFEIISLGNLKEE
jgi:predicted ATP-dependent endonuclease of OLD family